MNYTNYFLYLIFLLSFTSFAQETCTDYTSSPNTNISNSGTAYNTIINVSDSFIITDVNVTVDIDHNRNRDLDIYLISPDGTRIELSTDNGRNGDNYNNVTFDDDSSNTLPTNDTDLSGDYQPEGSLATLNGENSNGNWTIEVTDDNNGGGTINTVSIEICYDTPTLDYTCSDYFTTPNTTISGSNTNTYDTTINVSDSFTIADVNLTINIDHNRNRDLDIYLISPLGTIVEISTDNGGTGDDYDFVTFNDDSANTLPTSNTTLSGDYKPEGSLADFNGENSSGNWIVRITDDQNGQGGTIGTLSIDICQVEATVNTCTDYTNNTSTAISSSGTPTYNKIINVPDSFTIADVNLTVDIDHTWNSDLDIYLISPLGTIVEISTDNGGDGDDYDFVTFNDDSANILPGNVTTNLSGDYQPEGSLATFNGENASGNWTIEISDDFNNDGGIINSVSLEICQESTPTTPTSNVDGYLGPGGVGSTDGTSELVLWTNPDNITEADNDAFAAWNDASGYNSDLTQDNTSFQPIIKKSINNGYDAVRFETTNRRLRKNNFSNFPTDAISGFYINKTADSTPDGVLSYASSTSHNNFLVYDSSNLKIYRGDTSDSEISTSTGLDANNNVWNIVGFRWQSSGGTTTMSLNGNSAYSGTLANSTSITAGGTLSLAGEQDTVDGNYEVNQAHQGDFSEVILFNAYLSEVERIIVSNYLSAKYNIGLSANNFYTQDTSGENFDFNVAGIGQASDGSIHTDSQGTGIIRINTPSDLDNNEYLFWGEDQKDANYNFSPSAATNYTDRLDTKWRVNKTNDLGTVSVSINESDITLNSSDGCNDLKLIISSSSTFATKTTYDLVLSSGVYTATNVLFSNHDYFTIEYIDTIVLDATTAYNGSGTSNIPSTSDGCYKLLIKSTADGTPSISENANVREVEIESGGKLVVESGNRLQVTNGLQIDGDIRLVGSAQLIQTHTGVSQITGSGNLYVDQNSDLSSVYRYNYWTSPVTETGTSTYTVEGVMKDGTTPTSVNSTPSDITFTAGVDGSVSPLILSSYWIYGYLNGSNWSQKYHTGTFNPGEGYLLKSPGAAQNYTFKGTPNDGDISFSIDADKTSLLGNPYPSALDANQLFIDSPNLGTLYFWEHKNEVSNTGNEGHYIDGYIGGYGYRNATMGTAADASITGTAGLGGETYTAPSRYISIGQGFFASTADGLAATVNFTNEQRYFETESGDSHFFKTSSKENEKEILDYSVLKIGFEAKNADDIYIHSQIGISFSEGKTFNSEIGFDSRKSEIKDADIYFKFKEDSSELVIAGVQEVSEDLLVPLTLKTNNTENVYLMLDDKQNIDSDVFIFDAVNDIYYDFSKPILLNLSQGIYSNRFYITFHSPQYLSSEDISFNENFNISQKEITNELIIENMNNKSVNKISLFGFTGKEVLKVTDKELLNETKIILQNSIFSKAIYVIQITTLEGVFSKKIYLK